MGKYKHAKGQYNLTIYFDKFTEIRGYIIDISPIKYQKCRLQKVVRKQLVLGKQIQDSFINL